MGLGLTGCSDADATNEGVKPETAVKVESNGDDQPATVTISERAEERLGIRTEPVRALSGNPKASLAVAYAAVVYDADGQSWAFSEPKPRTFIRVPLAISSINGDQVELASGPPAGTRVVVVGAPELVGAEAGISGEE
jgi:hypothetical protein